MDDVWAEVELSWGDRTGFWIKVGQLSQEQLSCPMMCGESEIKLSWRMKLILLMLSYGEQLTVPKPTQHPKCELCTCE